MGDITSIATDEGWLFLAVVIDLFSRQLVGWSLAITLPGCIARRLWPLFATPVHYRHPQARSSVIGSIAEAIARPTTHCGPLQWFVCEVTPAPGNTSHGALAKDC